jgi:hypothetical protein
MSSTSSFGSQVAHGRARTLDDASAWLGYEPSPTRPEDIEADNYELAKPIFTPSERAEFASWAAQFVTRGIASTKHARDDPWVADVVYGDDLTNVARYGNSATWQRAMAVWAAVAVGGETEPGDNCDIYILNHAPPFGRGPRGPMSATH